MFSTHVWGKHMYREIVKLIEKPFYNLILEKKINTREQLSLSRERGVGG